MAYKMKGGELKFVSQIQMNDDFIIQYANQILEYAKKKGKSLTKKQCVTSNQINLLKRIVKFTKTHFYCLQISPNLYDDDPHDDLKDKTFWLNIKS